MPAYKAPVTQVLLGSGKFLFFAAACKLLNRHFKYIAQPPFRFNKKITAKGVAVVLDNDVLAALSIEGAYRMSAAKAVGKYRIKVTDTQFCWAVLTPSVENPAHKLAVLLRRD